MKRLNQIDLCRFVDRYTDLFMEPIPQKIWHIKENGGIPGMISKSFCGDIGTIHSIRLATKIETHIINIAIRCYDETITPSRIEGICNECMDILMARSRVFVIKKTNETKELKQNELL